MFLIDLWTVSLLIDAIFKDTSHRVCVCEDSPLKSALAKRIPHFHFAHQLHQLLQILIDNGLVDEHTTVGLAVLAAIVVDGVMRPAQTKSAGHDIIR